MSLPEAALPQPVDEPLETAEQWAERILRRDVAGGLTLTAAADEALASLARGLATSSTPDVSVVHVRAVVAVETRLRAEGSR